MRKYIIKSHDEKLHKEEHQELVLKHELVNLNITFTMFSNTFTYFREKNLQKIKI